ncbi:hypothetical protein SAMN06265367_10196 [Algoriphagus winogradskyi]|uniref:Uncharacterized protein n=1 Tax=Algoriphagus winogradskyi TaxID=237017 RepID=A0ABY1N875_9BACT|nr:hypothetical protein SAMN06265367_10196 [Algoriphagus winogradskyi]
MLNLPLIFLSGSKINATGLSASNYQLGIKSLKKLVVLFHFRTEKSELK